MECKTRVELRISCKKLIKSDLSSKSDPMAAIFLMDGSQWNEIARTEAIKNCHDPEFTKSIVLDYYFEVKQKMKFEVYDVDNESVSLNDDDFLGAMECSLGQIVSAKTYTQPLSITAGNTAGTIIITAEELTGSSDLVQLTFRAKHLDKKDFLSKSDPYLEFSKCKEDGSYQVIHRTEVVKNTLDPCWRPIEVPIQSLCNGDYNRQIKITCYDWDEDGSHDMIGEFTTKLNEMMETQVAEKSWLCVNPKKLKSKKNYTDSGTVILSSCRIVKVHTFLDYILGGCQINFTVGIDFTASNGACHLPDSLHFNNPYEPNEYMKAIVSVGDICQDYDTDKMFPALGFGAQIPPNYQVSHEFPLNFNPGNPYCEGISGVLTAYQACIKQVRLYGPTNVAPIINHVAGFAEQASKQTSASQYFVLLLLTDGVLSDMSDTKNAIVRASNLPLSIIIVGVGGADFSDMNELDADQGKLRGSHGYAARDIVQFVPFRDFKNQPSSLAKCVLAEVPKQVAEYFKMKNIAPGQVSYPPGGHMPYPPQ